MKTAVPFFHVIPLSHMLLKWFHFIICLNMLSPVSLLHQIKHTSNLKKTPNSKPSNSCMNIRAHSTIFLLFSPFIDLSSVLPSWLKGVLTCTACQCQDTGWVLGMVLHMRVGIARLASYGDDMPLIVTGWDTTCSVPSCRVLQAHSLPSARGWGFFHRCQMAIWSGSPDVFKSSIRLWLSQPCEKQLCQKAEGQDL